MKALTVKQPWADAIAHGTKRTENRTWTPPPTAIGARLLLHAGTAYDPMGRYTIRDWDALNSWPDVRGAVIATARLAGYHREDGGCCTPWGEPNVWHWQLTDVRPLPEPVPCRGALRLWTPNPTIQHAIRDVQEHTPTHHSNL